MPILSDTPALNSLRALALTGSLTTLLLVVSGCAQQARDPSFYDQPASGSATDATRQARNAHGRSVIGAPSQIQLDLHPDRQQPATHSSPDADTAPAAVTPAAIIAQAQTYLGTFPCFHRVNNCAAQRVTLTLAPNGRWRARVGSLPANGQPIGDQFDQGCWRAIPERPPRLVLRDANGTARAELVAVRGNTLRVRSVNGAALSLTYNLTRQPDLDPIDGVSGDSPICVQE